MEISSLRQSVASNAQLSLASCRSALRHNSVAEHVRGLPRLRTVKVHSTAVLAKLDSRSRSEGCVGDGGLQRLKFGGQIDCRMQETSVLRRRASDGRTVGWSGSLRAGDDVGSTVDVSGSDGVLLSVRFFFLRSQSFHYCSIRN